ncbi:MAG: hypothetical protein H6622_10495 [Halobacteriovoraceae bacterium]|nr:hypothetical protein [Halobacteriovoraceae bacterium]
MQFLGSIPVKFTHDLTILGAFRGPIFKPGLLDQVSDFYIENDVAISFKTDLKN